MTQPEKLERQEQTTPDQERSEMARPEQKQKYQALARLTQEIAEKNQIIKSGGKETLPRTPQHRRGP